VPEISGRSPQNPEKLLYGVGLMTEGQSTSEKIPTDRLPLVRFKNFSGQNFFGSNVCTAGFFTVRNLKNPKKIRMKVRTARIFPD
jgi:hypothetical protein